MLSPLETGTTRGRRRERGRSRETGPSRGYSGPGGRRAARGEDQATGLSARRGRARPLHLIQGGAVPDSARQEGLARAGTPATVGMPDAMIGGPAEQGEVPGPPRRAGGGNREGRRAGNRPVQDRRSASPQDRVPRRREQRRLRGPAPRHRPLPAGDQLLNLVVDGDRRLPLRLAAVVAQAGGPALAAAEPGQLERVEDARPAGSR